MKPVRKNTFTLMFLFAIAAQLAGCGGPKATDDKEAADSKPQAKQAHGEEEGQDEAPKSTRIARKEADANGIKVVAVGPGAIAIELEVQGQIATIDGSNAKVTASYPGRIRSLRANVGDRVRAGQSMASIQSNLSLSTYSVSAPISGVVLTRQAQVGGGAAEGQVLFDIADLSKVWVDLSVFGPQMASVMSGSSVVVTRLYDGTSAQATIDGVLPGASAASQSSIARATLQNPDGQWRPGVAVTAKIATSNRNVALIVPRSAMQTLDGGEAVFVRTGDTYTAHAVKLGEGDTVQVEVLEGLKAGDEVVVEQSYLVKADIEKSGASHEH